LGDEAMKMLRVKTRSRGGCDAGSSLVLLREFAGRAVHGAFVLG